MDYGAEAYLSPSACQALVVLPVGVILLFARMFVREVQEGLPPPFAEGGTQGIAQMNPIVVGGCNVDVSVFGLCQYFVQQIPFIIYPVHGV